MSELNESESTSILSRRRALTLGGGLVGGLGLVAAARAAEPVTAPPPGACVVTPQQIAGPYYLDNKMVRVDIVDHRVGIPLNASVKVIDSACQPVAGARVDIWHADAQGVYSGFPDQGDNLHVDAQGLSYLRGTQFTDAAGDVSFSSIYPGWYRARTTHLHFKIYLDQTTVLTAQMYLPDGLSEFIYLNASDYRRPGPRDTLNSTDRRLKEANGHAFAFVREIPAGYEAQLTLCVDRAAKPQQGLEHYPPGAPPQGRALNFTAAERVQALIPAQI